MSAGRRILEAENSPAFLPESSTLRRLPRAPDRARPAAFTAAFDDRALFYDAFRHADGQRILLVGPAPMNLIEPLRAARFVALPSGATLTARFHPSLSTMITELGGAPADTRDVSLALAGEEYLLPVRANHVTDLAGRRLLFSINKDNELGWIREWALWHARHHGTDAVVLVDNGSSRYAPREIADTLAGVPGIETVAVASWPYRFGPIDTVLKVDPYWSRFLQISSMSMVLRRYGERALGLINCDIDELAATHSGRSLYDLARESFGGLVVFRGQWVEPLPRAGHATPPIHRDYLMRASDPRIAASRHRKWALDPGRAWVRRLSVHPYWHWVEGRSLFAKSMPRDAFYWHFRGISTNWKAPRTTPRDGASLVPDEALARAFERLG